MAPLALVAVGVIGVSVGPLPPVGHASSFGGLKASSLGVWTETIDPVVGSAAGCDDFDGPGGPLDGRTTSCGSTWSATGSNWSVSDGTLTGTGSAGVATVDAGSSDATVSVDVIGASANNRRGGVVVAHGSTGPVYLAAVLEGPDGLRVIFVNGNSTTTLATAPVPIGEVARLALTRNGATVTVVVDGVQHAALTLTDDQNGALTGISAGVYKGQGPPGEFDDFEVTVP